MIHNILRSFQLTEKEITVFLKVMELGTQPASQVARILEMPRNTVRSILDNLVKRGILVKTSRANTQYYSVEKKQNIIRMLKHRKLQLESKITKQIELLEKYGDEFDQSEEARSRPKITFYEGISGLKKTYEDTLTAKNGLRSWASIDDVHVGIPGYFPEYYKRRAQKGIHMRSIHPDTAIAHERILYDTEESRTSALIPQKIFHWTPEIQIYNDKINIASWKEKLGIIIESREIAEALGAIFEMSWETACRYSASLKKRKKSD